MIFYTIYFVDRFGQILLWLIATLVQHERTEKINTIFRSLYGHLNGFKGFCHYPNVGGSIRLVEQTYASISVVPLLVWHQGA